MKLMPSKILTSFICVNNLIIDIKMFNRFSKSLFSISSLIGASYLSTKSCLCA